VNRWLYDTGLGRWGDPFDPSVKRLVFAPYARELRRARELVRAVGGQVPPLDNIKFGPQPLPELLKVIWRRRFLVATDAFVLY
jgi:hypothetical protein